MVVKKGRGDEVDNRYLLIDLLFRNAEGDMPAKHLNVGFDRKIYLFEPVNILR